jgi:aspartate racemase
MEAMRTIGLIGGLGVPAGIFYYERLVEAFSRREMPLGLLFAHADAHRAVAHVRAGEVEALAEYLGAFIESLAAGGAAFAVISAVTPHICIERLAATSPLPIVSILDAVRDELERLKRPRVALFGSRYVIESDLYGALTGFEVVRPDSGEIDTIDRVYQALALRGSESAEDRELFNALGKDLTKRHALDAMLLAGTDLSPMFAQHPPEFPAIDCASIHVEAIARAAGVTEPARSSGGTSDRP